MQIRPFESMRSIDTPLKEAIVSRQRDQGNHGPHNFVDSAEGTIAGLDMSDPQTREAIAALDDIIAEGYPEIREELEGY